MENRSDPRRQMKRHFAEDIAARLAAEFHAGAFDRLMVAAAPAMLGDLRRALSSEVRKAVAGEIAKDLTKTPEKELPAHFEDMLAA
jgi:protein required for attachment to host cells